MMKMHTFNFNDEQLGVIANALMEMPYKVAAPIFVTIDGQIKEAEAKAIAELKPSIADTPE